MVPAVRPMRSMAIIAPDFTGVDPEETSGYRYPRPISLIGGVQITF